MKSCVWSAALGRYLQLGFLLTALVLVKALALAQLRITSLNSSGDLTWTNSIYRGLYSVESGGTPSGPWASFGSVLDSDGAKTNRITFPVPLAGVSTFYRVAWMPPDAIGTWDYSGFDNQGTLVITGRLHLSSTTLSTSNSPVVYTLQGTWNLEYAGPTTNALWWLGPQLGTGYFGGTLELHTAFLRLWWPTNGRDNNMWLSGDVWANAYTGRWAYIAFGPVSGGAFVATKVLSTNPSGVLPESQRNGEVPAKLH